VGSLSEVLRRVLTEAPVPPSRRRAGLDARLEAICLRAMAREPGARFASMAEVAQALGAYLHDEPAQAAATVLPSPGRRRLSTWQWAVTGGLAFLILLAVSAYFLKRGPQAPGAPPDALTARSLWKGAFRFRPPQVEQGFVAVHIAKRQGDRFWGNYVIDGGRY